MRVRLTLRQPGADREDLNLHVTADATTTVSDVAAALNAGPTGESVGAAPLTLRVMDVAGGQGTTLPPESPLIHSGVRSGTVVEIAYPEASRTEVDRGAMAAVLKVLSGPDAGSEYPLPVGSSNLGRGGGADVRLTDPLVSKAHARINVGDSVEILDTNSANGIFVGGLRVGRALLGPGEVARLGSTEVTVVHLRSQAIATTATSDFSFVRSPRVLTRPRTRTVQLPQGPQSQEGQRFPVIAMIAPLLMGLALFAFTRSVLSVVFIALSPLLMVGSYLDQRIERKRRWKRELAAYRQRLDALGETIERGHHEERALLLRMHPSVAECAEASTRLVTPMWSRRPEHPEFLQVRLGLGEIGADVHLEVTSEPPADCQDQVAALLTRAPVLDDAPVIADLRETGGLGLSGRRDLLEGIGRAIVLQIVTLHSPSEVVVAALTSAANRPTWSWLDWLPHTDSPHSPLGNHLAADSATGGLLIDHIEELVARRADTRNPPVRGPLDDRPGYSATAAPILPSVVVLIDRPSVDFARLSRLAETGPDAGVYFIWFAESVAGLPGACRTYLELTDERATTVGMVRQGLVVAPVACESMDAATAVHLARTLAPVVDAGAPVADDSDLPRTIPVISLLGADAVDDPAQILMRWGENQSINRRDGSAPVPRAHPSDLRALVGHDGAGAFSLDLRTDGPHALVGGTTGAGKSEFLQTWILGMAHANSPDRVTFLFIDYKGGAAFAKCVQLPHCVGLVTDLSTYLVRRALRSLGAEIRYREHLLNRKGVKDLIELEKTGDPECPPSLIIIVDEFAALVSEIPEFVDGVVDVAQRGRSLGLHLILATQRPSGVIKDNLRANTNLRVALRMADEEDSRDVLGDAMAAHFHPGTPGRAAAKTGPGRITPFQSAFPGSRTPAVPQAPPIEVLEHDFGVGRPWVMLERDGVQEDIGKDIDRVVDSIVLATDLGGIPAPRKPWLETLAPAYNLERLAQRTDAEIVLGVLDDPDRQAQLTEYFRPDQDGNLLYVGAGGAGKSTALRTLAAASSVTPRGGPVFVYGLDFAGGALSNLAVMPHVGAIVAGDDEERVARLLRWLGNLVDERAVRYGAARAATLAEYRALAGAPNEPRILLLLDGFTTFRSEYDSTVERASLYTLFQRILLDGRSVGVHVAMTVDRPSAVPASVASAFQRKVVLRQADEDAYLAMGVPRDVLGPESAPGRALQVDNPQELQLAILGESGNLAAQTRLLEDLGAALARRMTARPEPIRSLPTFVAGAEMPVAVLGRPVLGVADLDLLPIGFEPTGAIAISGPQQSGRTSALAWLATATRRWHPEVELIHISPRRTPLVSLDCWTHSAIGMDAIGEMMDTYEKYAQEESGDRPARAFFVEHVTDFADSTWDTQMGNVVKECRRNGTLFVAEGEITGWAASSWNTLGELKNAKTGLLLQPDQNDGDIVTKTTLPRLRRTDFPVGRGFWVRAGRTTKVQVPLPSSLG